MLIKRNNFMALQTLSVKKMSRAFLGTLALCTTLIAPNAFASSIWYEKTVTVKVSLAELQTQTGVETTYSKLETKARHECRASGTSLFYRGETVAECMSDLMGQFVESINVEDLTAYHLSHNAKSETYALNAK